MDPPLFLVLLLPVSWLLLAHAAAAIGVVGGADADHWSSTQHLGNVHARRLLRIGSSESNHHALPPGQAQAPPPTPTHNKKPHHRRQPSSSHATAPPPRASQSPSAPAPSGFVFHPVAAPQHPLGPSARPQGHHDRHSLTTYSLATAASTVFLVMAVASFVYCRAKRVGTVRPWATGLSGQLQRAFVTGVPALKRSELEAACEDFSNIVGSTSSCMLYKGTLSSGVEIALVSSSITCAKDWSKECESHYRKKITSLSKVSHKNFMNLLGYCAEDDPFTRAMVFEYAPNGTLFEHLHVREGESLEWATRLRISMGIAYCLEHMQQLNPPVLPRSFDSSSIYLTDDFAAKVSDLHLLADSTSSSTTTITLSEKENSMVRQYGMLLLEILSGRPPVSEEEEREGSLEHLARCLEGASVPQPLAELMDPSLGGSFPEEAARALCEVARWCLDPDPSKRPRMAQVAARMKEITALGPEGATPKVSPLWWAELEVMSSS